MSLARLIGRRTGPRSKTRRRSVEKPGIDAACRLAKLFTISAGADQQNERERRLRTVMRIGAAAAARGGAAAFAFA